MEGFGEDELYPSGKIIYIKDTQNLWQEGQKIENN
jgi:hypothetical protein